LVEPDKLVDLVAVDGRDEVLTPVVLNPTAVRVRIQVGSPVTTKSVPVTAVVTGTPGDGFEIAGYRLVSEGDLVALRWELHWRDDEDGAPCLSHQSHFFEVANDRIRRHWMYCSGVHVYEPLHEQVPEHQAVTD